MRLWNRPFPCLFARPRRAAWLPRNLPSPPPPLAGTPRLAQVQQAANLADYLRSLGSDLVVMGDFNSTPWSRLQDAFRHATGLRNAPGLALTWPSWNETLLRLPIDQIFSRGNITMSDFSAAPATGSDHLPIIATLTFKPEKSHI